MDITEVLHVEDLENPGGSNSLKPASLFYWRDLYKSFIYPNKYETSARPVDFWYEDMFYGRVDDNNIPIYPLESSLKQLKGERTVLALNFVADAWDDLRDFILESARTGAINPSTPFYTSLDPVSGWKSVHNMYHEWNSMMYGMFSGPFMNSVRDQKIMNFGGFLKVYTEFVDQMAHLFSLTRESFILSNNCSPMISGLIIEIADMPHDVDRVKAVFLKDVNFNYVSTAAKRYGFKIDKNAPWRFVADLNSTAMKKYMNRAGISKKMAQDRLYLKSYDYELDVFKHYLWGWYNQYVSANPMVQSITSKNCKGMIKKREVLTEQQAFNKLSDSTWLRLYAYVRATEGRKKWNQIKFDRVTKRASEYWRLKNRDAGMVYLYKNIKENQKKRFSKGKPLTETEVDVILRNANRKRTLGSFNF